MLCELELNFFTVYSTNFPLELQPVGGGYTVSLE
jgi:hypothetical protein